MSKNFGVEHEGKIISTHSSIWAARTKIHEFGHGEVRVKEKGVWVKIEDAKIYKNK